MERHARLKTELAEAQTDITFFRAMLAKERVQALNREYRSDIELPVGGDRGDGCSEERALDSQDSEVAAEKPSAKRILPESFCLACNNLARGKAPQVGHTYVGLCVVVDKRFKKADGPAAVGRGRGRGRGRGIKSGVAQQEEQEQDCEAAAVGGEKSRVAQQEEQ